MTLSRYAVVVSLMAMLSLSSGCAWMQRGSSQLESPTVPQLLGEFNAVQLEKSTSGDVLSAVAFPDIEIVSTSQNALSIAGPRDLADRTWTTLVSFGEDTLSANGKYFVYVNDKPRGFFHHKVTNARMDVEKVITPDVLSANYPNEEEMHLAIVRDVLKGFSAAAGNLKTQDRRVRSCAMAATELLERRIADYKASPSSIGPISNPTGLAFDTPELGSGRIKMVLTGNIVKLKIVCGPVTSDPALDIELQNM